MRSLSFLSALIACVILGGLGVLTVVDILDGPGTPRQERVARTPTIPTSASKLPRFVADARFYATERYALKEEFIMLNGRVKLALFGHSPASNVGLGENGFLFLSTDETAQITQGQGRMSASERDRWQAHFAGTRAAFEGAGLPYNLVIGPNKHSIYPDYAPAWMTLSPHDDTRTADVMAAATQAFGPTFVDTRAVLSNARATTPEVALYHPTDTHWTEWGAALVLREALDRLGLTLEPPEYEVADLPRSGDLARMIGQQGRWSARAAVLPGGWTCADASGALLEVTTIDPLMPKRFTCGSPSGRPEKLVVFTDSFGVSAIPYLAARFQQVEFIWTDAADPKRVQELGADYVLQILVERKLTTDTPEAFLKPAEKS